MKCEAKNSKGLPCGNEAIVGEVYCQAHLKRRSLWYQRVASPYFVVPVFIAILGIIADILGIWTFRGDWSNKTKIIAGIEFINGGFEIDTACVNGICDKQSAGVSYDKNYEPIFHMVVGPEAGECLALGFSLVNTSTTLVRNVRVQVILNDDTRSTLQFCDEFEIAAYTIFPDVKMARKFSTVNRASIASYSIDEIAPRNAGFFTVPIRNSPNLRLIEEEERLHLLGSPTILQITHSADNSELGKITAYAYLSKMSDKAQGLVDHTLLVGHHRNYSEAIFTDGSNYLVNHLKSWFSDRPNHTEFVIGSFVSKTPINEHLSYSVPSEPIQKLAITPKKGDDLFRGILKNDYFELKAHFCSTVVQKVEGAAYRCDHAPYWPKNRSERRSSSLSSRKLFVKDWP